MTQPKPESPGQGLKPSGWFRDLRQDLGSPILVVERAQPTPLKRGNETRIGGRGAMQ